MTETGSVPTETRAGILSRQYVWITIGACALVFLGAFEALAVTTVMPIVSVDLEGERLFALAFAGPLATSVIGMVAVGNWSDRRGPVAPLYASVIVFVVGLLIAGLAPTMEVLVAGRFLQGFGGGAITVALYVVVARVYPGTLHPAIFAGFAAAWVIPSLIGPTLAGMVTEVWSWHWVFLGVVILVVVALLMVVPALRRVGRDAENDRVPWAWGRLGWAALAALAILALNLAAEIAAFGLVLGVVALVVAVIAVRPLLPKGTLRAARGLGTVILTRGLVAGAFIGGQVYLPYLLTERHGLSPTLAGLCLTGGALAWSAAATVQGRMGGRLPHALALDGGSALLLAGLVIVAVATVTGGGFVLFVVAWIVAGAGMGFMNPRFSVLTLALSTRENQGFNSAAMTVADSFGAALTLAIVGPTFLAAGPAIDPFLAVFAIVAAVALIAVLVVPRATRFIS